MQLRRDCGTLRKSSDLVDSVTFVAVAFVIGAMCCTKKLHLLGAVPIRGTDGLVGALCVAGAGAPQMTKRSPLRA